MSEDAIRLRNKEQSMWDHAAGPMLLRLLRFDSLRTSLLEHAYWTRAPWLVAPDVWRLAGLTRCGYLYLCNDDVFRRPACLTAANPIILRTLMIRGSGSPRDPVRPRISTLPRIGQVHRQA